MLTHLSDVLGVFAPVAWAGGDGAGSCCFSQLATLTAASPLSASPQYPGDCQRGIKSCSLYFSKKLGNKCFIFGLMNSYWIFLYHLNKTWQIDIKTQDINTWMWLFQIVNNVIFSEHEEAFWKLWITRGVQKALLQWWFEMRPFWHCDGVQQSPHPQCVHTGPLSGGDRQLQALQVTEREIINGKMGKVWKDEKYFCGSPQN